MLTDMQAAQLRQTPLGESGNRVSAAIEMAGVTQLVIAAGTKLPQPYVSDVARGRYQTITVENARKFAEYFGVSIEDLFPRKAA